MTSEDSRTNCTNHPTGNCTVQEYPHTIQDTILRNSIYGNTVSTYQLIQVFFSVHITTVPVMSHMDSVVQQLRPEEVAQKSQNDHSTQYSTSRSPDPPRLRPSPTSHFCAAIGHGATKHLVFCPPPAPRPAFLVSLVPRREWLVHVACMALYLCAGFVGSLRARLAKVKGFSIL